MFSFLMHFDQIVVRVGAGAISVSVRSAPFLSRFKMTFEATCKIRLGKNLNFVTELKAPIRHLQRMSCAQRATLTFLKSDHWFKRHSLMSKSERNKNPELSTTLYSYWWLSVERRSLLIWKLPFVTCREWVVFKERRSLFEKWAHHQTTTKKQVGHRYSVGRKLNANFFEKWSLS